MGTTARLGPGARVLRARGYDAGARGYGGAYVPAGLPMNTGSLANTAPRVTLPAMNPTLGTPQRHELRGFHRRLLKWYVAAARPLPWRATTDPYRIWVSEVMLQQTTVEVVLPYYERFIKRFPSVEALSRAPLDQVLRLWEGLGYYRRARNLHAAARLVMRQHAGRVPRAPELLRGLPGIGRYTAGAIASLAFDQPEPILEANTLRVYSRLLGFGGDPRTAAGQKTLWAFAAAILPLTGAGRINQALMELGASICLPARPHCALCPVARYCSACKLGLQCRIPKAARPQGVERITEAAVAVRRGGKLWLMRRPDAGRWAGMWDFPRFRLAKSPNPAAEAERCLREQFQVFACNFRLVATLNHVVTRFRILLRCFEAEWLKGPTPRGRFDHAWLEPERLDPLPMPVTARRLARLLLTPDQVRDWPRRTAARTKPGANH